MQPDLFAAAPMDREAFLAACERAYQVARAVALRYGPLNDRVVSAREREEMKEAALACVPAPRSVTEALQQDRWLTTHYDESPIGVSDVAMRLLDAIYRDMPAASPAELLYRMQALRRAERSIEPDELGRCIADLLRVAFVGGAGRITEAGA